MVTGKNLVMAAGAAFLMGMIGIEQAHATTITFDNLGSANDPIVGDEYINQGIVFSTSNSALRLGGTCETCSQSTSLTADRIFVGDTSGSIIGQFSNNHFVTDLVLTVVNPLLSGASISAFDANGNLLTTLGSDPKGDFSGQTFDFSGFQVNKFQASGLSYGIDDVKYTAVPEPSSILSTAALGTVGIGLMLKRKLNKISG